MLAQGVGPLAARREQASRYTEFSYMLLQALRLPPPVTRVRLPAADRRLRPVGQHHLRRRADPPRDGAPVHALMWPLITRSDGKKFAKSERRRDLARPDADSPFAFYQCCLQPPTPTSAVPEAVHVPDRATRSRRSRARARGPDERAGAARLAEEATALVHGEEGLAEAGGRPRRCSARGRLDDA